MHETPEGIHVLHVDDDPELSDLAATFLERENEDFDVTTASDAAAALATLDDGRFDCVVSDYQMPGMDGIEFLEAVRESNPDLPFVLFTGEGSEEVASEAISAGVTDYLQKRGGTDQYALLANRVDNAVTKHRAERRVERSEARLRTVIDNLPHPVFVVDESLTYRLSNTAHAAGIHGRTPEEVVGESCRDLLPARRHERLLSDCRRVLDTGEPFAAPTVELVADSGEERVFEPRLVPFDADADDSADVLGILVEVTERKAHERVLGDLHVATRRLIAAESPQAVADVVVETTRDILDMQMNGCWFYDAERDALVPVASSSGEGATAPEPPVYRRGEGLSWGVFESGAPAVYDDVSSEPGRYNDETSVRSEMILPLGEHGVLNIGSMAVGAFDEGDVSLAQVLAANAEAELDGLERERERRQERELTDAAVDAIEDVFYVYDDQHRLVQWNDRLAEVSGYDDAELEGMSPEAFFPPDEHESIASTLEELYETGHASVEATLVTKDGRRVPYELTGSRLADAEGSVVGFAGTGRDVTERREREAALARRNERLEEFASVVSHDLRNPLNVAQGNLALGREACDNEHFAAVADAHDRMADLIEDLLTLAREGDDDVDLESLSLGRLAEACWASVDTDDATLRVETTRSVAADESRVQQLLENLFRNGVEHAGSDVTVTVGDSEGGFYVADDGPGVPESIRSEVFDAGYSTADRGTGFGLSIVKRIAEVHGWRVSLTEAAHGGARFEFTGVESA